jgi:hypothetical protein
VIEAIIVCTTHSAADDGLMPLLNLGGSWGFLVPVEARRG